MKNRLLVITRNTIPYVKELRPVTKSIAGCILMQQLEYWFARYPDGFYKFMEPCSHRAYKLGQSWVEELAITPDEFRSAFDHIAMRYRTRAEFEAATDKFQGRFYCSCLDKRDGITYYYRNHQAVDTFLDGLVIHAPEAPIDNPPASTSPYPDGNSNLADGNSRLPRLAPPPIQMEIPICPDGNSNLPKWNSQSPQVEIPVCPDGDSPLIKEITTETTQRLPKSTTTNTPAPPVAVPEPEAPVVVLSANEIRDSVPTRGCERPTRASKPMQSGMTPLVEIVAPVSPPAPLRPPSGHVNASREAGDAPGGGSETLVGPPPEVRAALAGLGIHIGEESPAVVALMDNGVKPLSTAKRLVAEHGERACLERIAALPFCKYDDAGAFLVAALDRNYDLPPRYEAARKDKARRMEQATEEKRRAEQRQLAAEAAQQEREAQEARWEALSPTRRTEVERQARAEIAAKPMGKRLLEGPLGQAQLRTRCLELVMQSNQTTLQKAA